MSGPDLFECARCHESVDLEEACWSELMQAQLCYPCYEIVEEN